MRSAEGVAKGAYVLADAENGKPEVLLMATGSEVSMCIAAYEQLKSEGIAARVISMPSWELFEHQDQAYRDSVIPPDVIARVAVEKGSILGWTRYTGLRGQIIGMRTFGASAPLKELQRKYGFVPEIDRGCCPRTGAEGANGWLSHSLRCSAGTPFTVSAGSGSQPTPGAAAGSGTVLPLRRRHERQHFREALPLRDRHPRARIPLTPAGAGR